MSENNEVEYLIRYLVALVEVQDRAEVTVFEEIKRTVKKLDRLLNN